MDFNAAVFDLDGTIIDSNPIWEKLDRLILEEHNIICTDEFVHDLASMTYEEAAQALCKVGLNISCAELTSRLNEMAEYEYAHNIQLKDGVSEYLNLLKKESIKISLATASPEYLYRPVLKNNGIYDLFDAFSTTYEAGASKDSPAVFILASQKISVQPNDCIAFDDIPKALISAKNAGMYTVGVYDPYSVSNENILRKSADRFIKNFREMLI